MLQSDQQGSIDSRVTWRNTPPTPVQLAAWDWLWTRLLGHGASGYTPQSQGHRDPEIRTLATSREREEI